MYGPINIEKVYIIIFHFQVTNGKTELGTEEKKETTFRSSTDKNCWDLYSRILLRFTDP